MDIFFADDDLEKLCSDVRTMSKKLGKPCSKKLVRRLSDLAAAAHVRELTAGRPHPLKGDRAGQFAVDLHGGVRLVFEPDHEPPPTKDDGSIDWSRVTAIRIVYIGDYHD